MNAAATILLLLKRVDCNDGVASYLETLISGLTAAGDRVVIVSGEVTTLYGSDVRRRRIETASSEWLVIDGLRAARPTLHQLRSILSLIDRHAVDVVSPQGFAMLPVGALIGRLRGCRVVMNYHPSLHGTDASAMAGSLSRKRQFSYRALTALCRADKYIALSTGIAEFFRADCNISKRRIHTQILGVETDFYREPTSVERARARKRFSFDDDALVAVLPGRMNLSKGHDLAAQALRSIRAQRPEVKTFCLFPGGGDQRESIEADVLRDEADRRQFCFLGFVDRETLRDTYWAADLVLLPSRMEGFGLVVAEAMCCGAIVIRTPSGGWQDQVIEGRTGYVVPFNDPAALAAAILKVMDSPSRSEMRSEAIALAATAFAKSRMIAGTSALYRQIAALKTRPRTRLPSATA